jgi:protein-S-isoprenylcysteine O-methyltransferase Ste14
MMLALVVLLVLILIVIISIRQSTTELADERARQPPWRQSRYGLVWVAGVVAVGALYISGLQAAALQGIGIILLVIAGWRAVRSARAEKRP